MHLLVVAEKILAITDSSDGSLGPPPASQRGGTLILVRDERFSIAVTSGPLNGAKYKSVSSLESERIHDETYWVMVRKMLQWKRMREVLRLEEV